MLASCALSRRHVERRAEATRLHLFVHIEFIQVPEGFELTRNFIISLRHYLLSSLQIHT